VPDIRKTCNHPGYGLVSGWYQIPGGFEERLRDNLDEIRSAGNVILVIDEVHTLIGAGAAEGAIDAAISSSQHWLRRAAVR